MKKRLLLGALLAFSATVAAAEGLNLGWGDCGGDPATQNKAFACTTNTLTGGRLSKFSSRLRQHGHLGRKKS
jgi:hypothetical protein